MFGLDELKQTRYFQTAYLLVTRLQQMMILGSAIGVMASISGMYLSYFFNLPSGPAIVLVTFCFFYAGVFI